MRDVAEIAKAIMTEVMAQTSHRAWFDGFADEPQVVSGADVWGEYRGVRFASAYSHVRPHHEWWDYTVTAPTTSDGVGTWRLEVRAPSLLYPGWGRREVAHGKLTDTDEVIRNHIRYASGPLELLVEPRMNKGRS